MHSIKRPLSRLATTLLIGLGLTACSQVQYRAADASKSETTIPFDRTVHFQVARTFYESQLCFHQSNSRHSRSRGRSGSSPRRRGGVGSSASPFVVVVVAVAVVVIVAVVAVVVVLVVVVVVGCASRH